MRRRSDPRRGQGPAGWSAVAWACAWIVVGGAGLACVHLEPPLAPVSVAAAEAMRTARFEGRARGPGWRDRLRASAQAAATLEPGWLVPRRFLDDLAREDGLGHQALARAQGELAHGAATGASAAELARHSYLVGRLEGASGVSRFELATRLDPRQPWAHHGRAWMQFGAGRPLQALVPGREALRLARDGWERATFAIALARYHLALEQSAQAAQLLRDVLETHVFSPEDRVQLQTWCVRSELSGDDDRWIDDGAFDRGFWLGIELLTDADLTEEELGRVVFDLRRGLARRGDPGLLETLEAALAARPGERRVRLRARILSDRGAPAYGLTLQRTRGDTDTLGPVDPVEVRAARLASGETRAVLEEWLAGLPAQVLAEDGLPRRAELAQLVLAFRAPDPQPRALGEALLTAGWFREARGWAQHWARHDVDAALHLDARACAGRALVQGILRLLEGIDQGRRAESGGQVGGADSKPKAVQDLDQLVAALSELVSRASSGRRDLSETPRLAFGPVAEVLHPGPRFSAADEALGSGRAGAPVPGLAAELLGIGRFGVFGDALGGGGPDGTVLRLLAVETRRGEHLGVPYSGTVAWCEGTEVPSRPARRGARIVGAALHEGYWVDVQGVRRELERWRSLGARFAGPAGRARALEVLAAQGPRPDQAKVLADGDRGRAESARRERARAYAPLGEGDRVRLAVLLERVGPRAPLDPEVVPFEEILEVTAVHEEGHLLERTRFLPLLSNPFGVLRLLRQGGFSAYGVALQLEYRAQLVALAVVPEPRIVLAECLDALESGQTGGTPHASAYGRLLGDWLAVLSERLDQHPALDPERYLIHQLHHLGSEEVRAIALELARRRGLTRSDS